MVSMNLFIGMLFAKYSKTIKKHKTSTMSNESLCSQSLLFSFDFFVK